MLTKPGTPRIVAEIRIPVGQSELAGNLSVPAGGTSLVLFAHGSGSSRLSSRNIFVAEELQNAGTGTLLFDLLTRSEEEFDQYTRQHRFDIGLLAERLISATLWVNQQPRLRSLRIGYFGASTGSAAALVAASRLPGRIGAVVSRGGRPDLAGQALEQVTAPTLLIVGGDDEVVIELNQRAYEHLTCEKDLRIVPGASHLFEEPGTLQVAATLAAQWFSRHLQATVLTAR